MMKNRFLLYSAIASLGLFYVSGCTTAHPTQSPQLTFENYAPISLNVLATNIQESYKNKIDEKDVSGQFVLAPSEAIKKYAQNRFKAAGAGDGQFTIDIQESFVHMRQIEQKNVVLEWADVGKEDEYRIYIQVNVVAQPPGFKGRQSTTIKMDRTLIMPSSVTLAQREMRQTKFLETLISDLDKRVNDAIDQTPAIRG